MTPEEMRAGKEWEVKTMNGTEIVNANHPPKTIEVPEELWREAQKLIGYIGTTGAERTDVIRRAEEWLQAVEKAREKAGV